jgi:probable HAF family extracellular repeat protein
VKEQGVLLLALTAITLTFAPMSANAQVTFKGLGVTDFVVQSMSADGSVAVGLPSDGSNALRWTAAGGIEDLGGNMNAVYISRDGRTIVGSAVDSQKVRHAAIWQGAKNWQLLGGVPGGEASLGSRGPGYEGTLSNARGVSANGSVIVGDAYLPGGKVVAFRWDAVHGMVSLGSLFGQSQAAAVSADGNTIVGREYGNYPYPGVVFWQGKERLIHPFGWTAEAWVTNDTGSVIVGRGTAGDQIGLTTYIFHAWNGELESLGAVWPGQPGQNLSEYTSLPRGVTDDASVVAGRSGGSTDVLASIWTRETGMVYVKDYLTSKGVTNHQNWLKFVETTHVSPDGRFIAGSGINPQGRQESWIVTLR